MKKLILFFAILALAIVACQDNSEEATPTQETLSVDMSDFYVYTDDDLSSRSATASNNDKCYSMKVLNKQLDENPGLYKKMYNIEKHTRTVISLKGKPTKPGGGNGGGGGTTPTPYDGTINIPVYVYVIYSNASQNISDAQVNSQISVLNADFNDTNYNDVPAEFQGVGANIDINFTLATIDRQANSTTSWGTNNAVKSAYPAVPGHLTIWVANIGGGILGYAQFPGGNASTDGVVISPQYFGTTGTAQAPFDKGRTATHEVGHWLNLRHIWGDGRCKQDDFVADTPSSDGPNYGCPSYPTVNCRSNDMTMNYMDYTDDACMNMFTLGQKDRMRAIFASGGARENFVQ
ncbi:zinc metalloprotease [uncultured Lutibacter sp.]|uniref:zinc metalloprotease n=1 Tax=uncultured Lutibacter sp. TaxID=437739 RepID=UPI0026153F07|nr:zinc metalloprotease [uncultured Lutibacter sp.]